MLGLLRKKELCKLQYLVQALHVYHVYTYTNNLHRGCPTLVPISTLGVQQQYYIV